MQVILAQLLVSLAQEHASLLFSRLSPRVEAREDRRRGAASAGRTVCG